MTYKAINYFKRTASVLLVYFIPLIATSQKETYEIFAIQFSDDGWSPLSSEIAVGAKTIDSLKGCFMFWLLKGKNGKLIMVDAGFTDTAQHPQSDGYIRPDIALKKLNINPQDITDIILTHPHWDHMGGIELFPNAMIWIQKDDYDYFVGTAWQKNGFTKGFDKKDVPKLVQKNLDAKLTLIRGDSIEIIPGVRVFIGSKHTYESQYVLVNGTSGKTIIASDNIWFYYNLQYLLPIPTLTFDPNAYVNSMKRMKTMVSNLELIIPGHDKSVFDKFPKVVEGS
jgi:glyoxylase-like metal-dependent hydrolase (beta-lactamase superfamily II)